MSEARNASARTLRRVFTFLLLFLIIEYLVLPQIAGARKALSLVSRVNMFLLGIAILLEVGSVLAYGFLTLSLLPKSSSPGLLKILRIQLSTLAVSHLIPGGSAAGAGVGFRLLTESEVSGADAGFALGTQALGSAVVLNILLWLGLLVSIPLHGFDPLYGTAAFVGVVVLGCFSASILLLVRGEERAARLVRTLARHIPFVDEGAIHRLVHQLAARLRTLLSDRSLLVRATGWATANWLLDAASLWVFVAAFGHAPSVDGLVVAYGLANVLAAVPITPGGLGVVEAVLTSGLVAFGVLRGVAILGIISYRLVNFWLPIPVGGIAYLSHLVASGADIRSKRESVRDLAEAGISQSEGLRTWASKHGVQTPHGPQR